MAGACALKAFARPILLPHEAEHVGSGFQVPETPSKAAVPREPGATQPPFIHMEIGGPGEKRACAAFLSRGALGLLFPASREFPFAESSCQKLVLGLRCDGASALGGLAASGGMAGAWGQKAFARPILLPHEGEHVGSGFQEPEIPRKAVVPKEPFAVLPRFVHGERRAG